EVEREADEAEFDPEQRTELRRQKSRSRRARILARARRRRDDYSDAGKMAKAIGYLLNQRKPLRRFLEDGRIPLDNNACERAIRPIAIGRRNWLFAGSLRGGHAAAVVYTLIECCRIAQVDMVSYLADVLVRVATHPASRVADLLPDRWAATVTAAAPVELALAEPATPVEPVAFGTGSRTGGRLQLHHHRHRREDERLHEEGVARLRTRTDEQGPERGGAAVPPAGSQTAQRDDRGQQRPP